MRIKTTGESINIVALDAIKPNEMEPAKVYGKDDEKQLVDEKPVYRIGHVYVKDDSDRQITASIKVFSKPEKAIGELTRIRLTGAVFITPYVQNGSNRIAYSIVADGVEAAA